MKWREDRWLSLRIQAWQDKGLISREQAGKIEALEQEQRKRLKLDPVWLLAGFAGLCVALGLALIVAHNWEKIPALLRQTIYLCALVAVGVAYRHWQHKTLLSRVLAVIWVVAPLAGIGLWAQIYQLSGDPFKPFFIAWLMGLPLLWLSKDPFVAVLHQFLLGMGLFAGIHGATGWVSLGGRAWQASQAQALPLGPLLFHLLLALLCWGALLWQLARFGPVLARALAWAFFLLFLNTVADSAAFNVFGQEADMVLYAALVVLAWGGWRVGIDLGTLEGPVAWAGALTLYIQTWSFQHELYRRTAVEPGIQGVVFINVVLGLALLALAWAPLRSLVQKPRDQWWFKAVLLFPAITALVGSYQAARPTALFLANLCLAGTAMLWMFNGVSRRLPKVVNRGVLIMAFLIFTRFFDLFDDLLESGFAFILAGLGLGVLAWGLEKGRRKLLGLATEAHS